MNKRTILWIVLASAIVVLGILITMIFVMEGNRADQAPETVPSTTQAEATTAPPPETQPPTTLPPPPPNIFDPKDFEYDEQGYLTCNAGQYQRGIDVSSYQTQIDWQQVADSGIEFVIIRVGGRGYGEAGTLYEDSKAQQYYEEATNAGLKVGAYFFSQAISPEEAVEEAEYLLELTKGWELEMPVVYDWEFISLEARTAWVDRQTLTDCMLAFCDRITQEGLDAMIYFNPQQSRMRFHIEQITQYPFWLAMYSDWMTYPYKIDMWQYTNEGSVPGIEGNVDINLYFTYVDEVTGVSGS